MPYKNWQAISGIKDDLFRLLVATTKDEYVLAGLQTGFPEFFSEEPLQLLIPASALREAARRWSRDNYNSDDYIEEDGEICWVNVLHEFNIPLLFDGTSPESGYDGENIPKDMPQQLIGQRFGTGLSVEYRGIRCLVIDIGTEEKLRLHEVITEAPTIQWILLIAADHVDLNS